MPGSNSLYSSQGLAMTITSGTADVKASLSASEALIVPVEHAEQSLEAVQPSRLLYSLAPWEETHLPHEHDRIAYAYYPRRANGCPYAYMIVMVLGGGSKNP